MKNIMFLIGLLIISLSFAFSQVTPDAILPIDPIDDDPAKVPAWDIFVTCTNNPPAMCPDVFTITAYVVVNGVTYERTMPTNTTGFVEFNMSGMPSENPNNPGVLLNYTILVSPCGQTVKPYPTGSVRVDITATLTPC